MPNIKSAIKRAKTSEKRRQRNASQKSALRTAIKAFETAAASSNVDKAREALRIASQKLDKAVTKGLIHKNAAARKKIPLGQKAQRACRAGLTAHRRRFGTIKSVQKKSVGFRAARIFLLGQFQKKHLQTEQLIDRPALHPVVQFRKLRQHIGKTARIVPLALLQRHFDRIRMNPHV